MDHNGMKKLGSLTAKGGFKNEKEIVKKFNSWKVDEEAQKWLVIMGYDLNEIEFVKAIQIFKAKTDVQVQVTIKLRRAIDVQNLQVKLVSNLNGYNQIDKRWVDHYKEFWNIPEDIVELLKLFTGEHTPTISKLKDPRRMFLDEFSPKDLEKILLFFKENKMLIINDILKGRGRFSAEWMLVAQKVRMNARWILVSMNEAMNFFGSGEVLISPKGSLKIGKITVQRKGGDAGRKTSQMLQFKINPAELFSINP
jgi:hypothetical protein